MTDNLKDEPRVREVLSSKPITAQAAHDLLSRFLEEERQDVVDAEENGDELLIRLEHVCQSLESSSSATSTTLASMIDEDESKLDKKARKAAKKKAKKEKRKREKESAKKSKKSKTAS
jgi:uncharacterized membrane-anchored protein YhcB (DUF1043 family)